MNFRSCVRYYAIEKNVYLFTCTDEYDIHVKHAYRSMPEQNCALVALLGARINQILLDLRSHVEKGIVL